MQVVTRTELNERPHLYMRKLKESVFIYPTDTIYGIGCNALDGCLVDRIRELKSRHTLPFSVIAPSRAWIREHCAIDERAERWLQKLPGPFTLILKMRLPEELPRSVTQGLETLGVRIPDHWISSVAAGLGIPLITTSANRTGENHMRKIEDIPNDWRDNIQYAIYEGEIVGRPSQLVRLDTPQVEILER